MAEAVTADTEVDVEAAAVDTAVDAEVEEVDTEMAGEYFLYFPHPTVRELESNNSSIQNSN